jgi:hypothetical protein
MFQGPANDNRIWQFGGTSFMLNQTFHSWGQIQSVANPLWSYDPDKLQWTPYPSTLTEFPNYGAHTEAPDQGLAFYLGGQVDYGTRWDLAGMGNETTINLPGFIVIDLNNQTFYNISTPGLAPETYPRVGGLMQYVPELGDNGLLVHFGGIYREGGLVGSFSQQKIVTFDTIDVFDIASWVNKPSSNGTWYQQKATGDIPPPRIDSCVVMKSAPDNSSHNL